MLHRLCGPPSIPLSFTVAGVLPRWVTYRLRLGTQHRCHTPSYHRLQCGLPGYLILFDPHTFVPERQCQTGSLPSPSVFLAVSMHFTATPPIPAASPAFKSNSINGTSRVEPGYFTADLSNRLRTL
jgi:hypothetical protein